MVQARDNSGLDQTVRSGEILDIFCMVLCILQDQSHQFSMLHKVLHGLPALYPSGALGALYQFLCMPGATSYFLQGATQ